MTRTRGGKLTEKFTYFRGDPFDKICIRVKGEVEDPPRQTNSNEGTIF